MRLFGVIVFFATLAQAGAASAQQERESLVATEGSGRADPYLPPSQPRGACLCLAPDSKAFIARSVAGGPLECRWYCQVKGKMAETKYEPLYRPLQVSR